MFRNSSTNTEDETHVGLYLGSGKVVHDKGRDVGVVLEGINQGGSGMTDLSDSAIQAKDEEYARAIAFRDKQYKYGFSDLLGHDCSGFISWLMRETGVWDSRKNCDGLWALCEVVSRNELIA